ncbi:MAG TPA: ParB/RepB/Spo0J family partition protein [Acidimicrobiales bacterium]
MIPTDSFDDSTAELQHVPVGAVQPNSYQPRQHFDEEALDELTASIRALGVLQPILIRRDGEGYELIAGERRWRAAKRAGLQTIPALVRDLEDVESLAQAVVENLQREDLNPLETAAAYRQLIEEFGLTHEEVAERVGKSRVAITNNLRLFQLSPTVQQLVAENRLTAGAARALLSTPDRAFQESLALRAVAKGMSVREVEQAVRDRTAPTAAASGTAAAAAHRTTSLRPPGLPELEELLSDHLETSVRVQLGPKKGTIAIDFADLEDLERIYKKMTG